MTAPLHTETVRWFSATRRRADIEAQVMGRRAVSTSAAGAEMIGTITGTDHEDWYLVVTFDDGTWARLDGILTLVKGS